MLPRRQIGVLRENAPIGLLTRAEKLAIRNELRRAFPKARALSTDEARLRRALEVARLDAEEPTALKRNQIRGLAEAVRDAESAFKRAETARGRLYNALLRLPGDFAGRLVERAFERATKPSDVAEARSWRRRGDPLGLFVYELRANGALRNLLDTTRSLEVVIRSKRGAPKKETLTNLTIAIAMVYFKFAGLQNLGVYTSSENDPEGEGRKFASNLLKVAFPEDCSRPPAGIIKAAFEQAREYLRERSKNHKG